MQNTQSRKRCVPVQEADGLEAFAEHVGDLRLLHARLGDQVGQAAALQVLHHHPQLLVADQVALDNAGSILHNTRCSYIPRCS